MADFIIIGILAIAVFFIVRSQFRRARRGQCAGGCSGCSGCAGCGSNCGSYDSVNIPAKKSE